MKTSTRIPILLAVAVAVATAFILKNIKSDNTRLATTAGAESSASIAAAAKLPKLLDLGANKCIPCKMMAPILEQMKTEYAGTLEVEFIDVWKNPDAGKQYGIEVIPTQIFYDATGKELFRHIGFFSKADILAKWKELGVELKTGK